MPRERIVPNTVEQAVAAIIPYLEDTSNAAHKAIYFDGWRGLSASSVLRAIVKDPPSSLLKKFNKIIHIDCSRWKSRRALQRKLAQELELPRHAMDILDKQDEEDDFRGVDEGSRAEIQVVGAEIHRVLREHICLLVFHNGSDDTVDMDDYGIPLSVWGTRVLWTFRGGLRLSSEISENVDNSHLYLYETYSTRGWNFLLQHEAREIAGYTDKLADAAVECCLYLLSLNYQGGNIMDYNWATHASSYWVCDGIIQGGKADEAWELAASLHQQICMEDYSSNALPSFGNELKTPPKRWILSRDNSDVHPESTSFFLVAVTSISDPPLRPLRNGMFQQSDKLCVLKLCRCTFSFSSPPFNCCRSLRFLGLDGCTDQGAEEVDKQDRPAMDFFKSLWVLDLCYTDWELDLSPEIIEQLSASIREIHIQNGMFWQMNFAWRQLQKLHKLRVIDPTCSWEMGGKDEFTVLPSLSTSHCLKTLVLDGCVGLEHVEELPPLLESFSFDARPRNDDYKEAKISRISMAGCARLSDFMLHGSLPNLEKLDLSGTKLKTLDLRAQVVEVPCLQQVMLLGCEQLCAVIWPEKGMPQLSLLCIDNRGEEVGRILQDSMKLTMGYCQAYVGMLDMRFIQSLVLTSYKDFCWGNSRFSLNICISSTGTDDAHSYSKEKMSPGTCGKIFGPPEPMSFSNSSYNTYTDVTIDNMTIDQDYSSASQCQLSGCHVEIGDGIRNTRVESLQGTKAIMFVMNRVESLHVHDNSSITTATPDFRISVKGEELRWQHLKQCHVVRCPKMHTVFTTNYDLICFQEIENFWAADLLMTHCVWSEGRFSYQKSYYSFVKLRSIHLYSCPRLVFVLPLSWAAPDSYFPNLETLHIVNCGDLEKVFPVEPELLRRLATDNRKGVLRFRKLKHIYLHELPKLQHICEAKMFAPKLQTVRLIGCWSLRRLPAVRRRSRPTVHCEKDWWEKLEWDGLEARHDPSLFEPCHSPYYKKPLPRVSVLR